MSDDPKPRVSIRRKLDRLVLLSVGGALLVAAALSAWHEGERYLGAKRDTLVAAAQAFGAAVSRAVAAGDADAALQGIRAIGRVPGLVRAEVTGRDGALLAEIGSAVRLSGDLDLDEGSTVSPFGLLASRTVGLSQPIVDGGETVGHLALVADIDDLSARLRSALLVSLAGSAATLVLGLLLSHRLQRSITRPLIGLARTMAAVERTGDYRAKADASGDDETALLARHFNAMLAEIGRGTDAILAREDEIIERLSRAAEQRDDQTGQHVVRVAKVSGIIARRLGLDPAFTAEFCRASPMHDVGKISIPDAILFKPGRLDPEERRIMETHAAAGHRVLAGSSSKLVQLAAEIALTHHERWDGAGYPHRLAGPDIPLVGRITAVADVCDALLSRRPYKQPWTLEAVKAHLAESSGSHFDPDCVEALLACWTELEAVYRATATDAAEPAEPVLAAA